MVSPVSPKGKAPVPSTSAPAEKGSKRPFGEAKTDFELLPRGQIRGLPIE